MIKYPLINAFAAFLYIVIVVSTMHYGSKILGHGETIFIPMAMLSLFTLSAAVMGYIFFYQPFQLYFDGEKKKAANLFLQTVFIFAVLSLCKRGPLPPAATVISNRSFGKPVARSKT